MEMTLEGERLTEQEINTLLAGTDILVLLRGQWIEVDRERPFLLGTGVARIAEVEEGRLRVRGAIRNG